MAMQQLRSSTANKRPQPTGMSDGQFAINTNSASPGVFVKDSVGALVKVGPVHVGTTAPNATPASGGQSGNSTGELWLDTSLTPAELKTWDGSAWQSATGQEIPVSKLIDGSARQLLQTDAAGTGVEWTSNVDVPGTLDVTGATTLDSTLTVPLGSAAAPTVRFTGDTNTGIYSPGADQLALSTNGTGRLFVDANGRVTVGAADTNDVTFEIGTGGTGNKNAVIDLIGDTTYTDFGLRIIRTNSGANAASRIQHRGTGELDFRTQDAAPITFVTSNSERLRITEAGLVGIGTGSPGARLEVQGSAASASIAAHIKAGDGGATVGLIVDGDNDANDALVKFRSNATATPSDSDTKFIVTGQGAVGIGTTSPNTALSVDGSSALGAFGSSAPIITLKNTNATNFNASQIVHRDSSGHISAGISFRNVSHGASGSSYMNFAVRNAGTVLDNAISISSAGTTTLKSVASNAPFIANIDASEVARIDSSGRLLVGTSSARGGFYNGGLASQIQLEGTAADSFLSLTRSSNNASSPVFILAKTRATSIGGNTVVANGDELGRISWQGADGTNFEESATIAAFVDGTPGANDMPGRLVFSTTADGASSPTERMRIKSTGAIRCVTAFTVATLPAGEVGDLARVTDANAPAVGSTVTGGGAANALCWYNGTNWTVMGV